MTLEPVGSHSRIRVILQTPLPVIFVARPARVSHRRQRQSSQHPVLRSTTAREWSSPAAWYARSPLRCERSGVRPARLSAGASMKLLIFDTEAEYGQRNPMASAPASCPTSRSAGDRRGVGAAPCTPELAREIRHEYPHHSGHLKTRGARRLPEGLQYNGYQPPGTGSRSPSPVRRAANVVTWRN